MQAADPFAHMSDDELRAELVHRTADWTAEDWGRALAHAPKFGWSDQKISKLKAELGLEP